MSELHLIDPNFALPAVETEGLVFCDNRETPADIYGLYQPRKNEIYCRLPQELADTVSPGVSKEPCSSRSLAFSLKSSCRRPGWKGGRLERGRRGLLPPKDSLPACATPGPLTSSQFFSTSRAWVLRRAQGYLAHLVAKFWKSPSCIF